MKVLVTGGSGYVGSALVPVLAARYPVVVYCNFAFGDSLPDLPSITKIKGDIRDIKNSHLDGVTHVIHLAGIVTDDLVDMNPLRSRQVNIESMDRLCQLCTAAGVQRFIYASSSSIYGPTPDFEALETTTPNPITLYAEQKLEGEQVLKQYASQMETVVIRSATVCGPAPRMRLDTIVNIFSKQAWYDGVITVHGGQQWRSNIHIMDAVDCYRLLLESPGILVNGQTFNIVTGSDKAIDIARMVEAEAAKVVGNVRIKIDHTRQDNRHYRLSAAKMTEHLGWIPKFSVPDAIQENFRWFRARGIDDPNDAVYYNTRRMEGFMKEPDALK